MFQHQALGVVGASNSSEVSLFQKKRNCVPKAIFNGLYPGTSSAPGHDLHFKLCVDKRWIRFWTFESMRHTNQIYDEMRILGEGKYILHFGRDMSHWAG